MVISASWLSRTNDGDGTLNLRGVATVLAFSKFVKREESFSHDLRRSDRPRRILPMGQRFSFCYQ